MSKIEEIKKEYNQVTEKLKHPEKINDSQKFGGLSKKRSDLESIVKKINKYEKVKKELEENEELAEGDGELAELAKSELDDLKEKREKLKKELKDLIIQREERKEAKEEGSSSDSIIVEIRAGAGGDEASLFAGDLFNMYKKFVNNQGWKSKILDTNKAEIGGYKAMTFKVKGKNSFSNLKYEGGVHRVQRVPKTEKGGRIHTSTVSVAVLPEPDKKTKVNIDSDDIRVDTYRASGPGGQYVNTRDSAVRITHKPTGVVVSSQNERSQVQNKENAMSILKAKILEHRQKKIKEKQEKKRKSQIGQAKRSQKIRTYNFLQDRVTDHRIEENWHNLEEILEGELSEIIKALKRAEEKEKYGSIEID
ncbi:MAG: peptide chain release factor 1 [Patescibacteria group bacterium]